MTSVLILLADLLVLGAAPPVVGRPSEHFYGAVGERVRVVASISANEVRIEEPFTLRIAIRGAENPAEIDRPNLSILDEFNRRFFIDDLPDAEATTPDQRVFQYRLRPRSESVTGVPPLLFHYYQPKLNYFATTASAADLSLRVTGREQSTFSEKYFAPSSGDRSRRALAIVPFEMLMAAWLVPCLVFLAWVIWWNRRHPDAARVRRLRRVRVVRETLDQLAQIRFDRASDVAERLTPLALHYLRTRHDLPAHATTPNEVASELKRLEVVSSIVSPAETLLRLCDQVRFGSSPMETRQLIDAAERMVLAAEESA